ncbi:Alg9-like mannosyltransferase family-domain-containing protein [Cokeromyces recurvatus]|uniref:Alg9-like mannosyltransferase family-domain-containing protein n=1 Tax=Cokeromyces recurvatus TaxID=90255 RepID=UPI00221FAD2C|nr:Alg9-like mannosyltransferase family-domain-containing protein [Cokeromyces recurvatus]KAI7900853.1 Alg9-like mannosyltransferase family-domain-containing protein [Cokeromyces recurvatus]
MNRKRHGIIMLTCIYKDLSVYRLCKRINLKKPTIPMLLVATSQVTLAYHTRPFSNAFESVLLCLSLSLYADFASEATSKRAFFLGSLFSLGVFTRITFPLYAFPIGIAFIYKAYQRSNNFNQFITFAYSLLVGFACISIVIIAVDSVYYGKLTFTVNGQPFRDVGHVISTLFDPTTLATVRSYGDVVITPLNNLRYNLNVENLAEHGIHPRYTHFAVNLPVLYGPLFIFAFLYLPTAIVEAWNDPNSHIFYVLVSVLFSGVVGLSIIPHQEARFLCPLLVPLVFIYTWKQPKLPAVFWTMWIIFNIVTTYIFSVIHQGGIVPAMGFLQRQTTNIHDCHILDSGDLSCTIGLSNLTNIGENPFNVTTNIVFYKTYMPPRHLLVIPKENGNNHINIFDYSSQLNKTIAQLNNSPGVALRRHTKGKPQIEFAKSTTENSYERTLFVVPSFVPLPKLNNRRYLLMATYSPHVSFDDMDAMFERAAETNSPESQMNINLFLILSEKDDFEVTS